MRRSDHPAKTAHIRSLTAKKIHELEAAGVALGGFKILHEGTMEPHACAALPWNLTAGRRYAALRIPHCEILRDPKTKKGSTPFS